MQNPSSPHTDASAGRNQTDPRQPPQTHTPPPEDPAEQRAEIAYTHEDVSGLNDALDDVDTRNQMGPTEGEEDALEKQQRPMREPGDEPAEVRELDKRQNPRERPGPAEGEEGYPGPQQ